MVLGVVGSLYGLVKLRLGKTTIDSQVFRLHYRWTTAYCFLACALIAAAEYLGGSIRCLQDNKPAPKPITTYCWINSTYTINTNSDAYGNPYGGTGSKFSGLGNPDPKLGRIPKYHTYYQWVPFILFFQGVLFHLPHQLWKNIENKKADTLLQGLQIDSMDNEREKKKEKIVKYLKTTKDHNGIYSIAYIFCEILNFVNVVGQMFLIDWFLSGAFMSFGFKTLSRSLDNDESIYDPLIMTFPRATQCLFKSFGPSGDVQSHNVYCILPQNILNEKVFIFMWFWFVILANITSLQIVYLIVKSASPIVRMRLLEHRGKVTAVPKLEHYVRRLQLGDYFLLDILGNNMDVSNFKDVLLKIADVSEEDMLTAMSPPHLTGTSPPAPSTSNGHHNSSTYRPFYEPDDDPIALKRRMEAEEAAASTTV